jgi:NAD(P)-dependent dehydrogenase (short-subunit alcohol dehydrogenase family)
MNDPHPYRIVAERPVAIVTGGNRGLGLATVEALARRGYTSVLLARSAAKAEAAARPLLSAKLDVVPLAADVTDMAGLLRVAELVDEKYGRLDVLVNNAGIFPESEEHSSVFDSPIESIEMGFATNTLGTLNAVRAFVPLMVRRNQGSVVNVSSGMAGLAEMNGGNPAYRLSKVAVNALTRILSNELSSTKLRVNSVCPGWVRTDMGGLKAIRSIEEGIVGILWAATLGPDGPTGGFFRDGKPLAW